MTLEWNREVEIIYQDKVVWIASENHIIQENEPLPLAAYHEECTFRHWAIKALNGIGRDYRIAYMSPSFAGIMAAVKSGLAVAVTERSSIPSGIRILSQEEGFPELPMAMISMIIAEGRQHPVVKALAKDIAAGFNDLGVHDHAVGAV